MVHYPYLDQSSKVMDNLCGFIVQVALNKNIALRYALCCDLGKLDVNIYHKNDIFQCCFFIDLNKTNEVKFLLTIYSYFDVSMIMVIIINKNKYLKKSHKIK